MEEKVFRHSVKAVIIKDHQLLVESCDYGRGRFCKLPGGGQEWGETMTQALIRECKEELNIEVIPQRLLFARDYIAQNHHTSLDLPCFHLTELIFECHVRDFATLGLGSKPDSDAQQIKWIDLDNLAGSDFYPKAIIPYLHNLATLKDTIVLGDVN